MIYALQGLAFIFLFPSTFWSLAFIAVAILHGEWPITLLSVLVFLGVIAAWIYWWVWVL